MTETRTVKIGSMPPLRLNVSPEAIAKFKAAMDKSKELLRKCARDYARRVQEESKRRGWSGKSLWGNT